MLYFVTWNQKTTENADCRLARNAARQCSVVRYPRHLHTNRRYLRDDTTIV